MGVYINENYVKIVLESSYQVDIPEKRLILEFIMQNLHTKPQIRVTYF